MYSYQDKDDVQQYFSCQDCEGALLNTEYGPGQIYDPASKKCIKVPVDVPAEYVLCVDDNEPPEVIDVKCQINEVHRTKNNVQIIRWRKKTIRSGILGQCWCYLRIMV